MSHCADHDALQMMDVGLNQFTGSFDAMLGGLSFITGFWAERNMLSGSLPQKMASLGLMV